MRFYRDLLGFAYRSELRVQGEPSDTLLRLRDVDLQAVYLERDGTRIELLHYAAPGAVGDGAPRPMNARGLTHLSLRVDNLKDTLATLRAAGVRVLDETLHRHPRLRRRGGLRRRSGRHADRAGAVAGRSRSAAGRRDARTAPER